MTLKQNKGAGMPTVSAIIVTRDPDPGLLERVQALSDSVNHLVLVDNGSGDEYLDTLRQIEMKTNAQLIWNRKNLGIAAALNAGARAAMDLNIEWILTLDQDSAPAEDMLERMLESLEKQDNSGDVGIIAPRIVDIEVGREAFFLRKSSKWIYQRVRCSGEDLENITSVITSGALIRMRCFQNLGGFREDFFIDYVDTEFCLRAIDKGYRILVSCGAILQHQFGKRQRVRRGLLTLYPSFHSPERWYTISRNRIPMIRTYGLKLPHWLVYEIVATIFITFRMLVTEGQRLSKIRAILHGTYDGLRGNLGPPRWAEPRE